MVADFLDPTKPSTFSVLPSYNLKHTNITDPLTLEMRAQQRQNDGIENGQTARAGLAFPSLRMFCLSHREIVEPLLVFCCHGIRMRDTRCCGMILRLFISLVPEFHQRTDHGGVPKKDHDSHHHVPLEIASAIREYISNDVLKACITSFHEPYFVEVQKELASLIATILVWYSPSTDTPKNVLLSLPNVSAEDLSRLSPYIAKPHSHTRQQRAIVLEILKDLKGVSVSEMGKLAKSASGGFGSRTKRSGRSKMAQGFMDAPPETRVGQQGGGVRQATPDGLEGVANLFDS